MKNNLKTFFLGLGITLLFFYSFSFLVPILFLWLKQSITWHCFVTTVLLSIGSSYVVVRTLYDGEAVKMIWLNVVLWSLLLLFGGISTYFFDVSFDGQTYHLEAIMSLVNGWNPIHADSSALDITLWTSVHYPKASWYAASNVIVFFDTIEVGKMYNLVLLVASFLLSTVALLEIFDLKEYQAVFLGLLLGLNPIAGNQFLSFYLDGQISSLVLIFLALSILFFKIESRNLILSAIFLTVIALINLKFPSFVFSVIFSCGFLFFFLYKNGFTKFIKLGIVFGLFFLLGSLVIGYSPYVGNLEHGHPFYPLNKVYLLEEGNQPQNFYGANRFYKLFHATFSYQGCVLGDADTRLKNPLVQGVMQTYKFPDTRIGAFGPYFSLLLILSTLFSFFLFFYKENKIIKKNTLYLFLFILISIIVHPESWWGRYIPQLYFLPFGVMLLLMMSERKVLKYLGWTLLIVLITNNAMIINTYITHNFRATKIITEQLDEMRSKTTTVYLWKFEALRYRFKEKGIDYQLVSKKSDLSCETPTALYACTNGFYCVE